MTKDLEKYFDDNNRKKTWIPTKLIAERFGVDASTIRKIRLDHLDLIEGCDYIHTLVPTRGGNQKGFAWSQDGIDKLSKLITTDNAIEYRNQTLIPINTIFQALMDIRPHLESHEGRITNLEGNLYSPVAYSKLQEKFSKKRLELYQKGYSWFEVHEIAKGWTGLSKYSDLNVGQIEEGINKLDKLLGGN